MNFKTILGTLIFAVALQAQAYPGQGVLNYLAACVFTITPWTIPARSANMSQQATNSVVWWPEEVIRFHGPKVDRIIDILPVELPQNLKDQLSRNEKYFRVILHEGEVEPYVVFYSEGHPSMGPSRSYFKITRNGIVIPNGPAAALPESLGSMLEHNELWRMVNSWIAPAQFRFAKPSAKGEQPDIVIALDSFSDVMRELHNYGINVHPLGALSTRFQP